ncbi:MAG: threonine--tRNA ligase [Candidatus Chisholmbacteria bacterium]|nr:threonine--tRNA ligase [Candidatus Chisholmbacteria bacterium]
MIIWSRSFPNLFVGSAATKAPLAPLNKLVIISSMSQTNQEYLDHLRHSAAHLLAKAVLELWPGSHNAIGPSIDNGFYQDFDMGEVKISEADLPQIEAKMRQLLPQWQKFTFKEVSLQAAKKLFRHNPYKLAMAEEFAKGGKKLMTNDPGNFLDLCKMGHVANPAEELKHFKLLSVAGAYWRGDEKNKMLTRIYGTAWPSQKELERYLWQLEEAKKRDHKVLGKKLDLFCFSNLVGPGLPLWTPKGTILRNLLDDFVWELRKVRGYEKVEIPHLTKKDLYVKSGHWDKFKNELFHIKSQEGYESALKPMNCPHHTQIFARRPFSYREMPQRYATTTMVYRDEQSGELSGLTRVESITQDDSHVFCRENQIKAEANSAWDIADAFYKAFGFKVQVRLSLHDPNNPKAYLGEPHTWHKAESSLRELAHERGVKVKEAVGEAAFYGPKIDFMASDSLGRQWQVATIQLDFNMPERFNLNCVNEKGRKESIVMMHIAIMGSIERFLAIIIEHFGGAFPTWLSPVQAKVLPISQNHHTYANKVASKLKASGLRVEIDDTNQSLPKRVKLSQEQKIPYVVVVGDREAKENTVSVRLRGKKDQTTLSLSDFTQKLSTQIASKALSPSLT